MELIGARGTEPLQLALCREVHPHVACGDGVLVCHRFPDDIRDGNCEANRVLAFVAHLNGSVLHRSADLADVAPRDWDKGELLIRLYSNDRAFGGDDGVFPAFIVTASDASELVVSVWVLDELGAAQRLFDGVLSEFGE